MRTKNFTQSLKIILGMVLYSGLASAQGTQQEVTYESTYGNGQSFGYLEYLPVDYASSEEKFPLLISLHGLGWRAEGNGIQFYKLRNGNHVAKRIEAGEHFPAIVISPQQPKNVNGRYSGRGSWDANIIDEVLERTKDLRRVDTDRIYITGTSMGGGGVWLYLRSHGDKIAAAAPVCATQTIGSNDTKSSKIKDTPVWAFHNYGDNVVNRSSTENIMKWIDTNNPDNPNRKTIYAWSGHNSWDATYSGSGRDTTSSSNHQTEYGTNTNQPDVFEWMFAHNLRAPYPVRAAVSDDHPNQLLVEFNQPVAQASADGFRLEGTSVGLTALSSGLGSTQLLFTLSGEVQVGEIVSLYYDDQPGVLANSAGIRTNEFEDLAVENTVGFMKLQGDDIAVDFGDGNQSCPAGWNQQTDHQQGASLNNLKSVAGASSDLLIKTLTSFPGSYDDGTVTGDDSGVFPDQVMKTFWTVGSDTEQLSVEGLEANQTYNFHFFSSRSSSGGTRLTEYAVQGKTVTLDAKMNISRVAKITDVSPDASGKAVISMRLPEGSEYGYINALVIRAAGETSVEPVNIAPVVTTCADTLLRLPVDQVLLKGQAEDPDGTIVSYGWMQTTGPTQAQLSGTDTREITVSEVTAGEYTFQFSATDNQGATSSQEVLVTVE
ncbi:MAG: Ig-like domain-containing protein, partial [Tunicatimonas sp.]